MTYTKHFSRKNTETPQTEAASDKQQQNNAGGFSFTISDWDRLERFLIMGSEGGTYYVQERKLTRDNAKCVERCLQEDGARTVQMIVDVSDHGRAAKNTPALFALAMAAACGSEKKELSEQDLATRRLALDALPKVARIGTHLFQFAQFVNAFRGWGSGLRKSIANWYLDMDLDRLAFQAIKYPKRTAEEGVANSVWSHRDLLRKARPKVSENDRNQLFNYIVKQGFEDNIPTNISQDLRILVGTEKIKKASTAKEAATLVTEYNLPHEVIPKELSGDPVIWKALLPGMPLTATIRNLGRLTANGVLTPMNDETSMVIDRITNTKSVENSRIHPINILVALRTYQSGGGFLGRLNWNPDQRIIDALDEAFYMSFKNIEPTGKKHLLAIDCSGSMGSPCMGMQQLTNREAAACMALATMKSEKHTHIVGFSNGENGYIHNKNSSRRSLFGFGSGINALDISSRMRLDTVCNTMQRFPWGGTDCALPMLFALDKKLEVDVFCIYTDSETWAGNVHPHEALRDYRNQINPNAKLVVLGTASTEFSIADPDDPNSMDVCGFDSAVPQVLANFIRD